MKGAPFTGSKTASIAQFCRDRLPDYKIPRYVQVRGSFPMAVSGKIRKVGVREETIGGPVGTGTPAVSQREEREEAVGLLDSGEPVVS